MLYKLIRPILFQMDAERSHERVFKLGAWLHGSGLDKIIRSWARIDDARLRVDLCGLRFANPVGLAAGFDKNIELADFWSALGFHLPSSVRSLMTNPPSGLLDCN